MANNKVQLADGSVLIDITDTTAVAADVAAGKYFYGADGVKVEGTASGGMTIIQTQDEHGGTILDISGEPAVVAPKTITKPGTYLASDDDLTGFSQVTVESPEPSLQTKTLSPTESEQVVTPDQGYDGLSSVTISAISSSYVGSLIDRNDSTDLSVSGATVTVPAGYYAEAASKSVASGSATTPATTITANPTISVSAAGLITVSVSGSQNITPTVSAGYVSAGTAGAVSVSGSQTQQLSTQAAATITPTKSSQTAVAAGKYTTGSVTVAAIPAAYQDVTGVTAAAGDVVSGKSIVDSSGVTVNGTLVIQHYYTGSSTPSASLGVDGDIYLQTS